MSAAADTVRPGKIQTRVRPLGRLREMPPPLLRRKIGALLELFGLSQAANQASL